MIEILLLGSEGKDVTALKARLEKLGFDVTNTDVFDKTTRCAVISVQLTNGLVTDGIVGKKTLAVLSGIDLPKALSQQNINQAAEKLGCDVAAIMAVNQVESLGAGFHDDGQVIVLFERHIMRRRMLHNGIEANVIDLVAHNNPSLVNRTPGGYKGGKTENYRLKLAGEFHHDSALESASWGQYQIMGFHWKRLGFDSVGEMVTTMHISEGAQLMAFCDFILTDNKLHDALKNRDWPRFARRYNGRAYKKNRYDEKLATAYANASETLEHA